MIDHTALRRLRIMSVIEGISTLLLFFVAMPLKYFAGMPMAVTVMGGLHGVLFVVLLLVIATSSSRVPLPVSLSIRCAVGAVVPFGPFVVDRWLKELAETSTDEEDVAVS